MRKIINRESTEEKNERRKQYLKRLKKGDVIKTLSDYFVISEVNGDEIYGKQVKPVSINRISIKSLLSKKAIHISDWNTSCEIREKLYPSRMSRGPISGKLPMWALTATAPFPLLNARSR